MFKKRYLKGGEFSSNSGVQKWFFGASIFVVIALIWMAYFVSTQYLGKKDATISGTIIFRENPIIDVTVLIGNEEVVTDEDGKFVLSGIAYGSQVLKINKNDYIPAEHRFFVWKKKQDLGKIEIRKDADKLTDFSGVVLDGFNKKPIKGAIVHLGKSTSTTNVGGEFIFKDAEKGSHLFVISAIGYQDIEKEIELENDELYQEFFLSPLGKVSFTSSRGGKMDIYSVGYDGQGLKNYTANVKGDCWDGRFSADGKRLFFYSNVGEEVDMWGQKVTNLYFINVGGNEEKKINSDDIVPEDDYRISQAGDKILFLGKEKESGNRELYIANIGQMRELIRLTDNNIIESNFDISPDGSMVVFGAFEEGERKIFLVDVLKREIKPILTSPNREGVLNFSPDGQKILYTMEGYNFETRVFMYDISSSESKQIYRNIAGIKDIIWNSDGSKLAFIASRDDRNYIYSMDSDGTNEIRLIEESGNYDKLIWPPIEKILIVKLQEGDGKIVSVMDLTSRSLQKLENISNDTVGWQKN